MKNGVLAHMARRWLIRGESQVACTGLALATILLGAMGAAGWWTMRAERDAAESGRQSQAQAIAAMLAQTSESMLSLNELSAVRRLVVDAARIHQFAECRIILPNNEVIASADPAGISLLQMPATWSGAALASPEKSVANNEKLTYRFPLEIPGRGNAILEVTTSIPGQSSRFWQTQAGLGVIGAGSLLALLLIYRRMRSKFGAAGSIREALLARAGGERDVAALTINSDSGPEAQSWNQLLAEVETMKRQQLSGQVHDLGHSAVGGTDLEGVCDAMWQGLVLVDEHMRIKYANGAAAVLLRSKRELMIGGEAEQFVDASLMDTIRDIVGRTLRRRVNREIKREGDSGIGVLRFSIRPVRRGDIAAAMIIIEDITQQRLAEEARNSFVAQATHELRMPLTNIRLYVESALDEGEHDVVVRSKCLNVINQESKRLERIVGDMLSVSEIEAGTLKLRQGDVRLDTLFVELRADYEAQANEKEIEFKLVLPPKLPVIKGDRDKLTVALHNLIGNALKYTPARGKVTITVELTDHQLVIDVSDTGFGIKPEEAELIFEKFYRAKDQRLAGIAGSGLGLSVAREVIRLHRGDITVRSELNQGSTFTLTVPALSEAA